MKCCVINSSEMYQFGILNAEFYCNSTPEERNRVLSFRSDNRREHEIKKLLEVLTPMKGYDKTLRNVKKDLGLSYGVFQSMTSVSLNYGAKTKLLIIYRIFNEMCESINERKNDLKYEEVRLREDMRKLEELNEVLRL